MQSTFISYGGPDEVFARKLNEALLKQGVTTFLFAEDAEPGKYIDEVMRHGVNKHDRVILICSAESLNRTGVLKEIKETLARESADAEEYLIPITRDDYVFKDWNPKREDLKHAIQRRVIADFRDPGRFDEGVSKLIRVLAQVRPGA